MRVILPAVLVALLFAPTNSTAAPIVDITFRTVTDTETISFGLEPFTWTGPLVPPDISFLAASVSLISGPLLDLVVDPSIQRTIYTYGPGTLVIDASWVNPDSSIGLGTFQSPTEEFSLLVCEGCDQLFGGSLADDFAIPLGPGLFDEAFARFLKVERNADANWVSFGLEDISGDPSSRIRTAFDHRGTVSVTISAVAAPEPSLLVLSLSGVGAWIVARRRVRAAA